MKLKITSPSRIHATLIDMNGSTGRIDGGLGFTLQNPNWSISFDDAPDSGIYLEGAGDLDDGLILKLVNEISRNLHLDLGESGVKITIDSSITEHVGLGSKTQLSFSLADGLSRLLKPGRGPLTKESLARVTARGGTSGIGVAAYVHGGVILDGGHSYGPGMQKSSFLPSSASDAMPAPVIFHESLPADWRVVYAVPELDKGAHDATEVNVFQEYCPVPLHEVEKLSHLLLMSMMPALKRGDHDLACRCIDAIQGLGFKKLEIGLRGSQISGIIDRWRDAGAPCVGMSSFGPCIYCIARDVDQARDAQRSMHEILKQYGGVCSITKFNNSGASVLMLDD
ncbi:MAG: beta-ribofuranosylaminobenzene 5'-phosphate synthase family protein [Promethearchaeota archaeon]